MNEHQFQLAARSFRAGKISLNEFMDKVFAGSSPDELVSQPAESKHLKMDLQRERRCGFPEAIYGPGKSLDEITLAIGQLIAENQNVLATRLEDEQGEKLAAHYSAGTYNPVARTFRISEQPTEAGKCKIGICAAGTADKPVTEEAQETLTWMGLEPQVFSDIGIAGPHRLDEALPEIRKCDVLVVVAGAEGALPSVVGGHVSCPIIAVPTSAGYGTNMHGIAPLLSMLNSCTPNVAVVNIDAGFKAGYLAGLIACQIDRSANKHMAMAAN